MPPDFDPNSFQLATVLTAAGATLAAALIASIIEIAKKVPAIGPWIDAKREPGIAVVLSAGLVGYAYAVTTTNLLDPVGLFGAFLAFVGVAGLSTKAHDVAVTVTSGGQG